MIPLDFFLFYSGGNMSYLRYLCFKTLRHFHPNSKIQLYTTEKYKIDDHNWNREKQDFETNSSAKNYMSELKKIDVEIVLVKNFLENVNPVVQSDVFRYIRLLEGGIYLDTDQIILKSFESLPLQYDLLYSMYPNPQNGMAPYAPVGVLCANKNNPAVDYAAKNILRYYNPANYNSSGPFMWLDIIRRVDMTNTFNLPSIYWYPALHSDMVSEIYSGNFKIPEVSCALHLFLGHPLSQEFNNKYTEEFAQTSNDTISKHLRDKRLI